MQQADNTREFWNPIMDKESEVEYKRQRDAVMAPYSSANRQLMVYLENDTGIVFMYALWVAVGLWNRSLLAICDLNEYGTPLLALPAPFGQYLLSGCAGEAQVMRTYFKMGRTSVLAYSKLSQPQKELVCTCFPVLTIFVLFRAWEDPAKQDTGSGVDHDSFRFSLHQAPILTARRCWKEWKVLLMVPHLTHTKVFAAVRCHCLCLSDWAVHCCRP